MDKKNILKLIESKGFNKILWNKAGKAMHNYNMISPGDKIAVGVSGGKDSLALFNILLRTKHIVNFDFDIYPIYVSYSDNICLIGDVKNYIKSLGFELLIQTTNIKNVIFEDRKEKNPCALCSRLRRGFLYTFMKQLGCNKLALGHHLDDFIETFLMNFFYQGNMNQMRAKYQSEEYGFDIIRPMVYIDEVNITKYVRKLKLPVASSDCIYSDSQESKRKKIKELIKNIEIDNPDIKRVAKNALKL